MKKELMKFPKFKFIMETLIGYIEKRDRISNFLEKEVCEDSWCLVTVGSTLESMLINLLADEFDCWFSTKGDTPKEYDWWDEGSRYSGFGNDIEEFLYRINEEEPYTVGFNNQEFAINSIEDLYDFLVSQYEMKYERNLTAS